MADNNSTIISESQFHLGDTYGVLLMGLLFTAILFGLTVIQSFIFFQTNWRRTFFGYKLIVCWLCFLDAFHLGLIAHILYYYLVLHYADPSVLPIIVWSMKLQVVISMFVVYTVHCLYAHRIWLLSRGKGRMLPILVTIIVVLSTGIAISISVAVYQCYFFLDLLKVEWAIYLTLSIMAFNDILIAISMCHLLAAHRTGFASTDSTIKMLMMYIVHTGCLTSLFSVLTLLMYAVMPENFIFLGFDFLLAKLYVNSYLALLNAHRYQTSDEASSHLPRANAMNDINLLKDSRTPSFPGKPRHSSWSHEPVYENIALTHSRAESVSLPPLIPNRGPPCRYRSDEFNPTTLSLGHHRDVSSLEQK